MNSINSNSPTAFAPPAITADTSCASTDATSADSTVPCGNTGVVPANRQTTDGIDDAVLASPVALDGSSNAADAVLPSMDYAGTADVSGADAAGAGIWMPDNDAQGRIYQAIADSAVENGTAVECEAPCSDRDLEAAPSWNITPRFEMGVGKKLYLVDGNIYVRNTALTYPPTDKWTNCGPAPQFTPPAGQNGHTPQPILGAAAGATAGIWQPDPKTQLAIFRAIADNAFKSGAAKEIKHAPASKAELASAPHCDCTPKYEMGVKNDLYVVHGRIYVSKSALTQDPQPTWYSIGRAPDFNPPAGGQS